MRKSRLAVSLQKGFTLVEMMVIAPIVILLIGAFITLLVNLTGEVMSSRGSSVLTYDIQSALNRIEQDTKLSTTFLAVNNIDISSTRQGYGTSTSSGGTVNFTNVNKSGSGGSNASLILNSLVTNGNPVSTTTGLVYLADKPNPCSSLSEYSKNTPMTMNIVYFVDANNTLWRRTIMPADYANVSARCGAAPWQLPSCINGYSPANFPFCKTNDEKLIDGVTPSNFSFAYYTSASSTTPNSIATNAASSDANRNTAMQSTPTLNVSITANKTVAGRDISKTGTLRVTRLDTNASSIATLAAPTGVPSAPSITSTVSEGHHVTFTWPRIAEATSYSVDYRINGGAWVAGPTNLTNSTRTYTVTQGDHTDTVEVRVRAHNEIGASAYGLKSTKIPLWAPLILKGGWTNYDNTYSHPAYTRTKAGLVMFKGMVRHPGTPGAYDAIGSVPNDYKPTGRLIFGTTTSPNASARLDVNPNANGADILFGPDGSPAWYSLETISYVPASSTLTRTYPSMQNGWVNYDGGYSRLSYVQDSTGRVTMEGLVRSGSITSGVAIFTLPSNLRPSADQLYPTRSSAFAELKVSGGVGLETRGYGTNAFMSTNISYLPSTHTSWTNLSMQNGWRAYGSSFQPPQYTKTSDGVVHLRGLISSGTISYDSPVATLPAGFRPKSRILSATVSASAHSRLDIMPNGEVRFMGTSNAWYSLEGISFIAEQ